MSLAPDRGFDAEAQFADAAIIMIMDAFTSSTPLSDASRELH